MTRPCASSIGFLFGSALLVLPGGTPAIASTSASALTQAAALKIVVIEGENAVNIIQQKTAVAPVIEVRDRNDQPVAGAVVRFAIRTGRATFNGARTLTVTTNAAGRAAVTGLTPTGSGALQISASAAFQGQTAAVTIAQTNVLTAAQAATSASAGAGGAGGGAGAGAGGSAAGGAGAAAGGAATGAGAAAGGAAGAGAAGGISATTVGIIGGAAAGGTFALKEAGVLGGTKGDVYVGPISGILRQAPDSGGCFRDDLHSGTMTIEIAVSDAGTVSGVADVEATNSLVTFTNGCATAGSAPEPFGCCDKPPAVTGTTTNLGFNAVRSGNPGVTITFAFTGALNGTTIVGTYTLTNRFVPQGSGVPFGGSKSFPMTLTKQ